MTLTPVILIVDDEQTMRNVVGACVENIGHVLLAANVDEARNAFEGFPVSVCICDYQIGDETMNDVAAVMPKGVRLIGMSGLPRAECNLPPHLSDIRWMEKGTFRLEDLRLSVLEALSNA